MHIVEYRAYGPYNGAFFIATIRTIMPDIPTIEPTVVVAGDTLKWTKSLDDFPASTYTLSYVLHLENAVAQTPITFDASADDDDHAITVAAATTADWSAGAYVWTSYATAGSERYTIDSGRITIKPNPASITAGTDLRSKARVLLDAIESTLEGSASKQQQEMTLDGQQIKYKTIAELLAARSQLLLEVKREEQAEQVAKGLDSGNRMLTRFV